ncbi:MAG: SPOR domain-containing protein [gamma proteobacterium symbiont of Taylorina sp.]|nr:SPOR domain-containing protein [gamma proteobacterium symbiont of Taylorina sp.]
MPQLDRLGLKENPFNNTTSQRFFYADHSRAQIMESTEHLIEFSNNLQVIIGAPGVGKTHFLEALQNRKGNNWRIVKIQDTEQSDTLSLIQTIMNSFGAKPDDDLDLLEALEVQLSEINQLGSKPLLLIDNAQNLSVDSIRFLMQLSQQEQNDEPYIHIVLFSTSIITECLQNPEFKEFRDIIHIAILDNFDKEGVSGYLRHKMTVVGFNRESPFTPRIIDSIYNDSAGIPEKINFFAEKFLTSSGKAENYIEEETEVDQYRQNILPPENNITNNHPFASTSDNFEQQFAADSKINTSSEVEKTDIFSNANIDEPEADRIDEQLSRLTEQFDEIENMADIKESEQQADNDKAPFFNRELLEPEDEFLSNKVSKTPPAYINKFQGLNSAKFIIPTTIVLAVLFTILFINMQFDEPEKAIKQNTEQVELLPLELPPEGSFQLNEPIDKISAPQENIKAIAVDSFSKEGQTTQQALETVPAIESETEIKTELEIVEVEDHKSENITNEKIVTDNKSIDTKVMPDIMLIEPEPVIGSSKRQFITIKGKNFSKDMSLLLFFDNNKKEFSNLSTPKQWHFLNKNTIKLHLTTGSNEQKWKILAQNKTGEQSKKFSFKIIKPFTANNTKMPGINKLSPNPMSAANKRQTLTISGQGFSSKTIVELTWDNNKKQFSRRLTPAQFEYFNANKIQLFITTGAKNRQWGVSLINNKGDSFSPASFSVVLEQQSTLKKNRASSPATASTTVIKDKNWLLQQADNNFTIQLFGSRDKQAITKLVKKYSLTGDIARFETQRDGQGWYSMTYGKYNSKEKARTAVASLDTTLTNPKPWIRSFKSIKKQLQKDHFLLTQNDSGIPSKNKQIFIKERNDAWIWTQNPANYTIQLLTLSRKLAVDDFIRTHNIKQQSTQFVINSAGKKLYVLIYGVYADRKSAEQAMKEMTSKMKSIKPWVRSFSDIHGLMSN